MGTRFLVARTPSGYYTCSSYTAATAHNWTSLRGCPMSRPRPAAAVLDTLPTDLRVWVASWRRALLAENKSPATVSTYLEAVQQFGTFLQSRGMPTDPATITGEHIREFITDILNTR